MQANKVVARFKDGSILKGKTSDFFPNKETCHLETLNGEIKEITMEQLKAFFFVKDFEGDKGWLHKSLVSKIPTVITKNDTCNIRSGPGTNHGVLFTVEKGIPFKVLKRKGSWINIEHSDGDKGWIHKALVW